MRTPDERRRWPRMTPMMGGPGAEVRLRVGGTLEVRDISARGARVDGAARLLPGVPTDVHVVGAEGRRLVRGRVVWSRVRTLAPLAYESALVFDEPLTLLPGGYQMPTHARLDGAAEEAHYPEPRSVVRRVGQNP